MLFSSRVQISPSATLAMNALAAQKKQKGGQVFNLSVGEPLLKTPDVVMAAATLAMQEGKTLYTPVAGIPELRTAASVWMNKNYSTNYSVDNTIITCGGKHGLSMTLQALLENGDEVLVIAPHWVSYPDMVRLAGGVPKIIFTEEAFGWKVTVSQIEAACSNKTKVIILNNGGNPTGVLYAKEELRVILEVAEAHNLTVISDEVYSGLTYDNQEYISCGSFPEFVSNTIIVQSFSKHFAMTGWRVGMLFGPVELIKIVSTLQGQSTTGTSSVGQWAALAAIEHADKIMPNIREEMQRRRNSFIQELQHIFHIIVPPPPCGLYAFLSIKSLGFAETASFDFCRAVLEKTGVAMVPGEPFGSEGYVRLSFGGNIDESREALQHLAQFKV